MLSLILSIVALGLIITIHEFGHFLLAKLCGVGVVEFSLGMGPVLLSKVFGNTRYSLRILPFGGSCMMVGEEAEEENEEEPNGEPEDVSKEDSGEKLPIHIDGRDYPRSCQFVLKPAWKRFLIIVAGPVFNFLLAFFLSLIITAQAGYDKPAIVAVETGMPAAEQGLKPGDLITGFAINGHRTNILTARDAMLFLTVNQKRIAKEEPVTVFYREEVLTKDGTYETERGKDAEKEATLTPRYSEDTKSYRLGLTYNAAYVPAENAGNLIRYSAHNVTYCIQATVQSLRMMAAGDVGRSDVMGPVRMVAAMDETVTEASDYGIWSVVMTLFDMMILISGSLGAMNLLPIPALDGGRLVFILIELITGHAVPHELEGRIHAAGMIFLLVLMMLILFNDVSFLIQ